MNIMKQSTALVLSILFIHQALVILLSRQSSIMSAVAQSTTEAGGGSNEPATGSEGELADKSLAPTEPPPPPPPSQPPNPIPTASYLSLDGLNLVVMFDKPVELNASSNNESGHLSPAVSFAKRVEPEIGRLVASRWPTCLASPRQQYQDIIADSPIQGLQMCGKLLTKKTLKTLHKFRLHNCIWPTRTQLLIQIAKPVPHGSVRVTFQRGVLREYKPIDGGGAGEGAGPDVGAATANRREISLELQRLPLEALGVPLAPRLALTGPNQVPPCGQFSLSAHLSSPYGTRAGDSVRLSWSVERVGFGPVPAGNGSQLLRANSQQQAASELQWVALKQLVTANKANNLLLDSRLLQQSPQRYEFLVSVTFVTSMATITLNASHQVSRLDFEAPIGTVYGSHLLAQQPFINPSQDLLLLADIRVPECASNVKQVGLYWQVSDPRVRFEQTYSPYYLARPNSLPEQSTVEFRLNVFYGIRVKKYASSGSLITTGDSMLEAQISGGALVIAVGREVDESAQGGMASLEGLDGGSASSAQQQQQLELVAGNGDDGASNGADLYTYQWSCFDGKTAQPCARNSKTLPQQQQQQQQQQPFSLSPQPPATATNQATNSTPRYEIGSLVNGLDGLRPVSSQSQSSVPLIEPKRQRQQVLRLPKIWLQADAQLWFGLQRFDRQNPSHKSQSEYTLVSVHQGSSPTLTIGPVLVGKSRHRATVRNPLTGAVVLVAGAPAIVVGRIAGGGPWPQEQSFAWRLANQVASPLKWNTKNATNPINGRQELISELHLSKRLLVAHAHYQLQLVACNSVGQTVAATLSVDVVSGVSQCRVGAGLSPETLGQALVVAVEHCNIPLGLSPLTYQLYMVESMVAENSQQSTTTDPGGARSSRDSGGGGGGVGTNEDEDEDSDYVSEEDQLALLSKAQPLTSPQLSPVFSLAGFGPDQLMAMIGGGGGGGGQDRDELSLQVAGGKFNSSSGGEQPGRQQVRKGPSRALRFGARVCDQLKSCRIFFSATFGPAQMLTGSASNADGINEDKPSRQPSPGAATSATDLRLTSPQMVKSIQSMIEGARRANLAGNSIAAIAILNSAINIGQKLTNNRNFINNLENNNGPKSQPQDSASALVEARIRDLVQVAARDYLNFGSQSIQRQFHYTESGQTNLVMHSMGRILSLPQGNIELKFRAIRLITQLTQRTISEQLNTKINCLADLRSIQWVYGTLYGTFSHYSVERLPAIDKHHHQKHKRMNNINNNNRSPSSSSLIGAPASSGSSGSSNSSSSSPSNNVPIFKQAPPMPQFLAPQPIASPTNTTPITGRANKTNGVNRKKREEAILAYLKSVRLAYRALISAAAIQLPLGDGQEFRYSAGGSRNLRNNNSISSTSRSRSTSQQQQQQLSAADIVSSLTHLTEITDSPIPIELPPEFGSISLQLDKRFSQRLRQSIEADKLICRNETRAKCSTFVLSITWFAGKSPFRSLDETGGSLKVPVLEIGLLSPLDGSDLMDMIDWGDDAFPELSSSVTFAVPKDLEGSEQQQNGNKHKCYKFDEEANEWAQIEQVAVESLEMSAQASGSGGANTPVELIRCRFKGLGAIGAFKGRPSPGEGSVGHSVALFILGAVGIVLILSLISCLISSSRSSDSDKSSNDGEDDDSARKLGPSRRHPEETTTYRNDFNYPL